MALIPLTSLVSYWPLSSTADVHGSNTLTNNNSVTFASGKVGNAADFEATSANQRLSVADNAGLSPTGDCWIGGWVQLESVGADREFVSKFGAAGQRTFALLYVNSTTKLRFAASNDGTTAFNRDWTANASAATWYRFDAWHDDTANLIYFSIDNGTPVSTSMTGTLFDSTTEFAIGARSGGSIFFDGLVDEVHFAARKPTAAERAAIYNAGSGVTYSLPTNSVAPALSGVAAEGRQLLCGEGSWGTAFGDATYQWYTNTTASTSGGTTIGGATASTYTLTSGESGLYVYCVVTVTNSLGSDSEPSNVLGPVGAAFSTTELEPNETTTALYAWWETGVPASYSGSVYPANGARVGLLDLSGNGRHLTTRSGVQLPLYQAAMWNGYPSMRFGIPADEEAASLECASFWSGDWTNWTWLHVFRNRVTGNIVLDGTGGSAHWLNSVTTEASSPYRTSVSYNRSRDSQGVIIAGESSYARSSVPPNPTSWLDGTLCNTAANIAAPGGNGNALTFGHGTSATFDLVGACYWRGIVDPLEFASVQRYFAAKYGVTQPAGYAIVSLGNSTTGGSYGETYSGNYINLIQEELRTDGIDAELWNLGVPGGTTSTLTTQATLVEDVVDALVARGKKVVITIFHGHNNGVWNGTSSGTVKDQLETYLASLRSTYPNDVRTISISGTSQTGDLEANWQANQDWHRNDGLTYHDGIVQTDDYPINETYDAHTTQSTYRTGVGSVHFSPLGVQTLADIIYPEVLTQFQSFAATGGNSFSSPLQGPFFSPAFSPANPPIIGIR